MSIFNLFRRKPEPEMSEKKKAFINKSGAKEKNHWRMVWVGTLYMLIMLFVSMNPDIVAECFPDFYYTVTKYFSITDLGVFLLSIPIGIVVGVVHHKSLVKQMKNVEHATQAADYLEAGSVDVHKRTDTFVVYKSYSNGRLDKTSYDPNKGNF